MPQLTPQPRGSFLLVEECFAREDPGFIPALRKFDVPKVLAAFADRWKTDPRPWARAQLLEYLNHPLDCPGHQPLVKRLFKAAEARRDDEIVAAFLVAFDVSVRRERRSRWRWDPATRSGVEEERLVTPRNVLPSEAERVLIDSRTGERLVISKHGYRIRSGRLFRYRTRYYLRRRAWRYFRWLGYARPGDYPRVVAAALQRYQDVHLAKGENILDSWALLNVCYRESDVLVFDPVHVRLKPGRTLGELRATPRFASAWSTIDGARALLGLISRSTSHLIRLWAMDLWRQVGPKVSLELSPEELLAFLDHNDDRVQQFGAELFAAHRGLDRLPLETWLRLLSTRNLTALATLTDAFRRHVMGERLSLNQCVELACAKPAPIARLGFHFLSQRSFTSPDYQTLAAVADARCPAVAAELTSWALKLLGASERYDVNVVSRFFDSLVTEMRWAAWEWLVSGSVGYNDPVLWSRLAETPFDELRLKFVDHLAERVEKPSLSTDQLAPIWCAVLLGVHRGGRQKLKAVRQVSDAIARQPDRAASLLPVLAVAVRSIRGPEMRAGLAAVMTLLARHPELEPQVRALLPELNFQAGEVAA